jgi:hypothetical protein
LVLVEQAQAEQVEVLQQTLVMLMEVLAEALEHLLAVLEQRVLQALFIFTTKNGVN